MCVDLIFDLCFVCVKAGAAPRSVLLPRKLPLCLAGPGIPAWRNGGNCMLQMVRIIHPSKNTRMSSDKSIFLIKLL